MAEADRSARLREFFARYVTARGRAADLRIVKAFATVPRETFAGPGPWSIKVPGQVGYLVTPDDDPAYLYQNTLVAIDASRGIHIGEPSLHAQCLEAVSPRSGEAVLQIGAGSGYYTAILAHLVGQGGRVHAIEIEADLASRAARNLSHLSHVAVECRSGLDPGLPKADVVYVSAGLPRIPEVWLDALTPGGRLIFPFEPAGGFGAMLRIGRPVAGRFWPARFVAMQTCFIGCRGGEDDSAGHHLAAALRGRDARKVRSLCRDSAPDATCWLRGDGWWLSTTEP